MVVAWFGSPWFAGAPWNRGDRVAAVKKESERERDEGEEVIFIAEEQVGKKRVMRLGLACSLGNVAMTSGR